MKKITYFSTLLAGLVGVANAASHTDPETTESKLLLGSSPTKATETEAVNDKEASTAPSESGSDDNTASNTPAAEECSFKNKVNLQENLTAAIKALKVILAHTENSEETSGSAAHDAVTILASMGIDALKLQTSVATTEKEAPAEAVEEKSTTASDTDDEEEATAAATEEGTPAATTNNADNDLSGDESAATKKTTNSSFTADDDEESATSTEKEAPAAREPEGKAKIPSTTSDAEEDDGMGAPAESTL